MRDEVNVCVSNINIGFKLFLRGVNGRMLLRHGWCSKKYGNVRYMRRSRAEKIDRSV